MFSINYNPKQLLFNTWGTKNIVKYAFSYQVLYQCDYKPIIKPPLTITLAVIKESV